MLLPKGFTEYIYHVANANELNSMIRNGLIPGGTSLKRGTQAVFFITVNPMEDLFGMGETPCDHTKPRIAPYKNTWKHFHNTICWFNLKLAQERGLQFYQTRSHVVVLHRTLLAACIEKAVFMKTQDELHQKVRLTPRVPRVVLKSNSQFGLQDPQNQDAISSWKPPSDSKSYGEICNNTVNHRISGVPLSAVDQQNTTRESKVKRLIEKFENHKRKESFIQDLGQMQMIYQFSKESQVLIADLNNTEIFELCENSSNQQCPDCNAYWEIEIIYCSCGRGMKSTPTRTTVTSPKIPGYVIKKNSSRGAKDGPSERQKMYHQAKQMLEKARQGKHGGHLSIHSRWYACDEYKKSLSDIGWREHHVILHDKIALEKHICKSTRAGQNSEFETLDSQGNCRRRNSATNQRPDFSQAKRECKRLQDEHLGRTQQEHRAIPRSQPMRQRKGQQFKGNEYDYAVDPETGWRFCKQSR